MDCFKSSSFKLTEKFCCNVTGYMTQVEHIMQLRLVIFSLLVKLHCFVEVEITFVGPSHVAPGAKTIFFLSSP